jgi:CubicO group peptidase (beta-lactamase class C family)
MILHLPAYTLVFALLLSGAASRAHGQSDHARAKRVDSIFANWDKPGSPGAAVLVVREGRILFEKGYGYANLDQDVRITPETVFDLASVSKQFAGLAIAMLVEQGRIQLTDDVRKYIPELHAFSDTIRILHLVHHTSGLRDWPGTLGIAGWRMDDVISFDQILRFAYNQRALNFKPGDEYTYSNTGYNLLAKVVERVTGKSFRAWTEENIFAPLRMTSTHFHDDHQMLVPRRALGYGLSDGRFRALPNNLTALGSSSLYSTARDLAKWVTNFDDAKVGGERAIQLMRSTHPLNSGAQNPYAFGLGHGTYRGLATLSHSGGWAGFSTFLLHVPQKKFGVIVLANTGMNTGMMAQTIAGIFLESELTDAATVAQQSIASGAEVEVPASTLDRYTGVYKLAPAWYITIYRVDSRLYSRATAEGPAGLAARSPTSFWIGAYSAPMEFTVDSAGAVTMLYRGRRVARLALRAPPPAPPRADLAGEYVSEELKTSYAVEVSGDTVKLRHFRHGEIAMTHAWREDYRGASFFLSSVEFQRDASGRVTGFAVNAGERVRNVVFVKR